MEESRKNKIVFKKKQDDTQKGNLYNSRIGVLWIVSIICNSTKYLDIVKANDLPHNQLK
jgi:hypothetical protein